MSTQSYKIQGSSSMVEIKVESLENDLASNGNSSSENLTEGKWLDEENVKFVIFMTLNKEVFKSKEKRKAQKIFKNVSTFIQTRSARQCRSHFQKLTKKFGTVFQMKKHYRDLIGHQNFDELLENSKQEMSQTKILDVPQRKEISVQTEPSEYSLFMPPHLQAYLNQTQNQIYYYFPTDMSLKVEETY